MTLFVLSGIVIGEKLADQKWTGSKELKMDKEQNKKAFASAEKEVKEEDVKKLKEVIKATLRKLAEKEKEAKGIAEEIKILRNDIKDFREGRLNRIAERQKESAKAKETSVFKIVKDDIHHLEPNICSGSTVKAYSSGTYQLDDSTVKMI